MKLVATTVLLLAGIYAIDGSARAEPSSTCRKQCSDQQQACKKSYQTSTCKAEYDRCVKACGRG